MPRLVKKQSDYSVDHQSLWATNEFLEDVQYLQRIRVFVMVRSVEEYAGKFLHNASCATYIGLLCC